MSIQPVTWTKKKIYQIYPNLSSTSWSSIFDFYILDLGLAIHQRILIYVSSLASPRFFSGDSLKGFDFRRFLLVRDFEDTYGQSEISLLWSHRVSFWCIPYQIDCGRFRVCEVFSLFKESALLCLEDKGDSLIFAEICVIPRQLWQSEEKNNHCDLIFLVQTLSGDDGVVVGLPLSPLSSSLNSHRVSPSLLLWFLNLSFIGVWYFVVFARGLCVVHACSWCYCSDTFRSGLTWIFIFIFVLWCILLFLILFFSFLISLNLINNFFYI